MLRLKRTLSKAVTAELTGSKAAGYVLKACLSFSTASQTLPIPMWDLHTTIKLSICQSNGESSALSRVAFLAIVFSTHQY